jgi:hypothetical protein
MLTNAAMVGTPVPNGGLMAEPGFRRRMKEPSIRLCVALQALAALGLMGLVLATWP